MQKSENQRHSAPQSSPVAGEVDWQAVLRWLTSYAAHLMQGHRWRGKYHGIAPDGFDPESVAAEAISQQLGGGTSTDGGQDRDPSDLGFMLENSVNKIIHNLLRRMENQVTVNELDWESDEPVGPPSLDQIATGSPAPDDQALSHEQAACAQRCAAEFRQFIAEDAMLSQLFDYMSKGYFERKDLAAALRLPPSRVSSARKRLHRKFLAFLQAHEEYQDLAPSHKLSPASHSHVL